MRKVKIIQPWLNKQFAFTVWSSGTQRAHHDQKTKSVVEGGAGAAIGCRYSKPARCENYAKTDPEAAVG